MLGMGVKAAGNALQEQLLGEQNVGKSVAQLGGRRAGIVSTPELELGVPFQQFEGRCVHHLLLLDINHTQFQVAFFIAQGRIVEDGVLEEGLQQHEKRSFVRLLGFIENGIDEGSGIVFFLLAAVGAGADAEQGNISKLVFFRNRHNRAGR